MIFYLFAALGVLGLLAFSGLEAAVVAPISNTSKKLEKTLANFISVIGFISIFGLFFSTTDVIKDMAIQSMGNLHGFGLFFTMLGFVVINVVWIGIMGIWMNSITIRDRKM